ncbi:MAG: type II secretion system minor pseudopilin GspI [Gammaproteobacteria bacterium]|nr:type II secretion system minor pseudopilin GspI [Gammaproteobacteria bacterium]
MHNVLFKISPFISSSFKSKGRSKGFTLLEVMVALAVIALALAAATSAVSGNIRNASGLQQRTYAHWVAMNKLTEMQLARQWPATKTTAGSSLMAKQEWYWSTKVTKTPDGFDLIRKVDISVRLDEDDESSLITLTGFVGRP